MEKTESLFEELKAHMAEDNDGEVGSLNRELTALYNIYAGIVGGDQVLAAAGRFDALKYIHDKDPYVRLLGMERLIFEKRDLNDVPEDDDISDILAEIKDKLADLLTRRSVEEQLEQKISDRMAEKHKEYINEIKQELIEEESDSVETTQSRHKLAKLEAMDSVHLTKTVMEVVRPRDLSEMVGQSKAVKALASKIASPYPQHVILYGPPGVGKTTAARLVLEEAKKREWTAFQEDAPFVECDGTTLRFDSRDITNPLLGSVHDPIYQGAQRELAEDGVPEPKPGLVTDAHGGILFIDEIGEMDPLLLNKLLKVLEDKRVHFESAYYDEDNPAVPAYIKKLFRDGAPADFILIGATTESPDHINPAIRSRCAEVFFEPLQPEHIQEIVRHSADKLKVVLDDGVAELISDYTMEGRKAVNLLSDAYSLAVYETNRTEGIHITMNIMRRTAQEGRLSAGHIKVASDVPVVGHIYGLGVSGFWGSTIEIEAAVYPAHTAGKGRIHFNDTAGTMAKDSVATASSVVRAMTDKNLSDYDLHINIVGGGQVDGPSAGAAITVAIISALEKIPVRQDMAVTGEISLSGHIKPVGGVYEKAFGAHQAGMKGIFIPFDNKGDIECQHLGMTVKAVKDIKEILDDMLVKG